MFRFFPEQTSWSLQTLRALSESLHGGGEFNEIHRISLNIRDGNFEDWYNSWNSAAGSLEQIGDEELKKGHLATAKKSYLRASNYYRMTGFYLRPDDKRERPTFENCLRAFRKAMPYLVPKPEPVSVPFEGSTMDGYFYSARAGRRNPAVIYLGGTDSFAEEMYFLGVLDACERGLSMITVDTPGQGRSLRNGMYARPDYEKPVGAIIDYFSKRDDVDPQKFAVLGRSMGGYYAPRVAAFEKRIKACAVWGACYDVVQDIWDFYPHPPLQSRMAWLTGAKDPEAAKKRLKAFTLAGAMEHVTCPLLVVHGEEDWVVDPKSAYRTYEEAKGPKELKMYETGKGGLHCNHDNPTNCFALVYDWLADQLKPQK